MAMRNPKGRANYQPNSWGEDGGPRANPTIGFRSFREEVEGAKVRLRPESFADHYSQARQFFVSQTPIEQKHLCDALVFELSKVERPDIRERMVAHLVNIHDKLAGTVANGLGIELPEPARAAQPTREDLKPSPALSIVERGPQRFEGRKLGILATDGADAALFSALTAAVTKAGGVFELVAPKIAGVTLSDGQLVPAKQKIDGGPSVLYDAVALLLSADGAAMIAKDAPSNDFVRDAFAHCKFIAYTQDAQPLLEASGIAQKLDEGCVALASRKDAAAFVELCGRLRHWERELSVDLDAESEET
jgi:catalase